MNLNKKYISYLTIILIAFIPLFLASCDKEEKASVGFRYDPDSIPMIKTDSMTTLVSDSGLIRYKIITKTWDMYEQAKEPYSFFPDGLYLEQFDTLFNVVVTIKADTAWNYNKKKLWQLKGNVFVLNSLGETFSSDELFWNQQTQKVYSDKPIVVDSPIKGVLYGIGFDSNQQMTGYVFRKVRESPLYVKEDSENEGEDEE